MLMEKLGEHLPKTAIISVGHRPELEAFHERKVTWCGARAARSWCRARSSAPPISILSSMMKRWRAPPAASPRRRPRPAPRRRVRRARRPEVAVRLNAAGRKARANTRSAERPIRASPRLVGRGRDQLAGPPARRRRANGPTWPRRSRTSCSLAARISSAQRRRKPGEIDMRAPLSFIVHPRPRAQQGAPHPLARRVVFPFRYSVEPADFARRQAFRQPGDDLQHARDRRRTGGRSRPGPARPRASAPGRARCPRRRTRVGHVAVAGQRFAPRPAPMIVADAAHHARQERQQRHVRRPGARAIEHAHDRLVQHVGPAEPARQPAAPQPRQRLEADQIGVRQGMERARRIGRSRDRPWPRSACLRSMMRSMLSPSMRATGPLADRPTNFFRAVRAGSAPPHPAVRRTGERTDGRSGDGCGAGTRRTCGCGRRSCAICRSPRPSRPCRAKDFLGPRPVADPAGRRPATSRSLTPDDAPHWLYHDVLVGDRSGAQAQQRHAELLGAQSRSPRPAARRARAAGRRRHRLLLGGARRDRRPARPRHGGRV